jgi:hypothetical protein
MKRLLLFFVFIFVISNIFGQNAGQGAGNSLPQLDGTLKGAAADIHKKLSAEGAQRVSVGQFTYRDSIPSLGSYWAAQLIQELTIIPNRSWILLAGSAANADWIVSGEIIEAANTIRIYTRLIRSSDRSIAASLQSDFTRDEFLTDMLSGGDNGGRTSVPRDAYEPDSLDNPLTVEIAANDDGPVSSRTIHSSDDADFFLLVPDKDGALTLETTGNTDTFMELYNNLGDKIAENDDGGSRGNAQIRLTVQAGSRYIAKVHGYSGETGNYGFRAFLVEQVRILPDEYEEDDSFSSAKEILIGIPQRHTFSSGDDVDWVRFQINQAGPYTIRTRGVNSNRLDTYIELFDSKQRAIGEDDDGGEALDSRLSRRLERGTYYLKVQCLDDEPDQPYTINVEAD